MVWPIQTFFELAQKWVRSAGLGPQGDRASSSSSRRGGRRDAPLPLPRDADDPRRARPASSAAPGRADRRRLGRARRLRRAGRPARPLPAGRARAGQRGRGRGGLKGRAARRAARPSWSRARRAGRAATPSWPSRRWGVRVGGVDLADVPLAEVRGTDPGLRHRELGVRRHPAGADRPARAAEPRSRPSAACTRPPPRTSSRRCRAAGRAGSTSVAAACPAVSGSGSCWPGRWPRPGDPGPGRADLGGRRAHRGDDRRAAGRSPARPDDRRDERVAAAAAPRRPGGVPAGDGRVIDGGRHDDLLRRTPAYRRRGRSRRSRRRAEPATDRPVADDRGAGDRLTEPHDRLRTPPRPGDAEPPAPVPPELIPPPRARPAFGWRPGGTGTCCGHGGPRITSRRRGIPSAGCRSPTGTRSCRSSRALSAPRRWLVAPAGAPRAGGLGRSGGAAAPRRDWSTGPPHRRHRRDVLDGFALAVAGDRRRAGAADLLRAADLGGVRPGPAGRRAGVRRRGPCSGCRSAGSRARAPATWSPG